MLLDTMHLINEIFTVHIHIVHDYFVTELPFGMFLAQKLSFF